MYKEATTPRKLHKPLLPNTKANLSSQAAIITHLSQFAFHSLFVTIEMASHKALLLVFFVLFSSFLPSLDARKLLDMKEDIHNKKSIPALEASLVLSVLPKGTVPASSPSKKGHDTVVDEKLIARHLAAIDRILRSVPSPGVGH